MRDQTPRINATYLDKFVGQTVRFVGKVVSVHGQTATIDAGGQIKLVFSQDENIVAGASVELVGKVQPGLEVKVLSSWDIGDDVDFSIADAVVEVTHRHKGLFYDT